MSKRMVQERRVYEKLGRHDDVRVLVDRIWPRGATKRRADLDEWCKDIAPSTALRKWFGHDPKLFKEFTRRYRAELKDQERAAALVHLENLAKHGTLTLLTATKDPDISEAAVLADLIRG